MKTYKCPKCGGEIAHEAKHNMWLCTCDQSWYESEPVDLESYVYEEDNKPNE